MAVSRTSPSRGISISDLRLLEQRAFSGRPVLGADELSTVLGGGYSDQPDWSANMPPSSDTSGEISADRLNSHLGGVLAGRGQDFINAGKKYGVNPALLASISMFETGNGTSSAARNKNNLMGISGAGSPWVFNSPEASLDYGARNLKVNYLDRGLDTVGKIAAKWAPVGAANDPNQTNNQWAGAVNANLKNFNYQGPLSSGDGEATPPVIPNPVYVSPVDRSSLKTITGRGELSTGDEMDIAKARVEDQIAKANVPMTVDDYQQKLNAAYDEVHKLNIQHSIPGTRFVEPKAPSSIPDIMAASTDAQGKPQPSIAQKVMAGHFQATGDEVATFANSQLNDYLSGLAKNNITLTEPEVAAEYKNLLAGAQKLNMGLQPTAMSSADATSLADLSDVVMHAQKMLALH